MVSTLGMLFSSAECIAQATFLFVGFVCLALAAVGITFAGAIALNEAVQPTKGK